MIHPLFRQINAKRFLSFERAGVLGGSSSWLRARATDLCAALAWSRGRLHVRHGDWTEERLRAYHAEIAARFEISGRTVETHRANLMRKLGIRSVARLTQFAIREGLVERG